MPFWEYLAIGWIGTSRRPKTTCTPLPIPRERSRAFFTTTSWEGWMGMPQLFTKLGSWRPWGFTRQIAAGSFAGLGQQHAATGLCGVQEREEAGSLLPLPRWIAVGRPGLRQRPGSEQLLGQVYRRYACCSSRHRSLGSGKEGTRDRPTETERIRGTVADGHRRSRKS